MVMQDCILNKSPEASLACISASQGHGSLFYVARPEILTEVGSAKQLFLRVASQEPKV